MVRSLTRIIQIVPVGYEYDRVIEGVLMHPCNVIYLLKSFKEIENEFDPDKRMIEHAEKYVLKLEQHFIETRICTPIVVEAILIQLEPLIEELCKIIQEEIYEAGAEEIWINISTSTKIFVSAAMYVGSFMHDYVRLFYIDASHYIIDDLFDPAISKDEIMKKYEEYGMTIKKNKDSYKNVDVPLYPTEILSEPKEQILQALHILTKDDRKKVVTFMDLLRQLGEDPFDKKVKMKYGHHISALRSKNLINEVSRHGRQKRYQLTHEGHILGLILSYFGSSND